MIAISRLFIAAIALSSSTVACASDDVIAVRDVSIDIAHCLDKNANQLEFSCHRFEAGNNFGVALRRYIPSPRSDGDSFEKLTILLDKRPINHDAINLPTDRAFVFFSSGSSSFPGKSGCYGVARSGKIKIINVGSHSLKVEVAAVFDMKSPMNWVNQCKKSTIVMTLDAKTINRDELNAWLGKRSQGVDIWSEAHPDPHL